MPPIRYIQYIYVYILHPLKMPFSPVTTPLFAVLVMSCFVVVVMSCFVVVSCRVLW